MDLGGAARRALDPHHLGPRLVHGSLKIDGGLARGGGRALPVIRGLAVRAPLAVRNKLYVCRAYLAHACILLFLCGCATSHKLEAHEDATLHEEQHSEASGEKHEGPWTETVYEFGPSSPSGSDPRDTARSTNSAVSTRGQVPAALPQGFGRSETVPEVGPLVKVTVREHSGDTEAWRASGSGLSGAETHLDLAKADKTAPSSGCALGLGFWGAIALVVALCALWAFRKALPWVGRFFQ